MDIFMVILKKEIKNFMIRPALKKWFLIMIFILFLVPLVKYDMPVLQTYEKASLYLSLFLTLLIPNTLSIDVIGGEKYHKTLESLISTPVNINILILGKVSFIFLLSVIYIVLSIIITNVGLLLFHKTSMLNMGLSIKELIIIYLIVILFVILISLLGSLLSLTIKNLKLCGYIISAIEICTLLALYLVVQGMVYNNLIKFLLFTSAIVLVLLLFSILCVSKQMVLKFIK